MKIKSNKVTLAATKAMAHYLVEDAKINILNKNGVNMTNQLIDILYSETTVKEMSDIIDGGGDHVELFYHIAQTQEFPAITLIGDARIFLFTVENYKRTRCIHYDFIPAQKLVHRKLSNKANKWKALAQVFESEYIELTEHEYKAIKPWLDLVEIESRYEQPYDPGVGFFSPEVQKQLALNGLI